MNYINIGMNLAVLINIIIISRIIYTDSVSETTPIPSIIIFADGTGPDRVNPFTVMIIIKIFFLPRFPTIVILDGTVAIEINIDVPVSHPLY